MRSKKLAFRKDWKAQITRSACRSSVLKSIHTIHALGCQVLTAPPHLQPYSDSLLHRSPFWLSIIKDGILTGSYRENGCHIWWRGLREYDRLKRSCIPQCIRPPHYLYGMLLKPGQGRNRICWCRLWIWSLHVFKKIHTYCISKRRNSKASIPPNYNDTYCIFSLLLLSMTIYTLQMYTVMYVSQTGHKMCQKIKIKILKHNFQKKKVEKKEKKR